MTVMMTLHDDQFGRGKRMAFPTMSTCVACIAVMPDTLVAVHKSADNPSRTVFHQQLFGAAVTAMNGAAVQQLFIVGFIAHHSIANIKGLFGVPLMTAHVYDLARKNITTDMGLCTFAEFTGAATEPEIAIKRSTKVQTVALEDVTKPPFRTRQDMMAAVNEQVLTQNVHTLKKHFQLV